MVRYIAIINVVFYTVIIIELYSSYYKSGYNSLDTLHIVGESEYVGIAC